MFQLNVIQAQVVKVHNFGRREPDRLDDARKCTDIFSISSADPGLVLGATEAGTE